MKLFFEDHPSSPIIKIQMLNSQQGNNFLTQGTLYPGGGGGLLIIDVFFFFFPRVEGTSTGEMGEGKWGGGGKEGQGVYGSKQVREAFVANAGNSFYSK